MAKKSNTTATPAIFKRVVPSLALAPTDAAADNPIRRVHVAQAPKLSAKAEGCLTYAIGIDNAACLYVQLQGNTSGGLFSAEWVRFSDIDRCLQQSLDTREQITSGAFRAAFKSKSQNNAGFLAAVLKAVGVLASSPEKAHHLQLNAEQWRYWQTELRQRANTAVDPVTSEVHEIPAEDDDAILNQLLQPR